MGWDALVAANFTSEQSLLAVEKREEKGEVVAGVTKKMVGIVL